VTNAGGRTRTKRAIRQAGVAPPGVPGWTNAGNRRQGSRRGNGAELATGGSERPLERTLAAFTTRTQTNKTRNTRMTR